MLLASPLLWEHYLLLLGLPLLLLWPEARGLRFGRVFLVAATLILSLPRPELLWDAAVPVLGEFAVVRGKRAALPVHTLTVLSYPLYTVVVLFVFACWIAPRGPGAGRG
jgi:hypothetical protein